MTTTSIGRRALAGAALGLSLAPRAQAQGAWPDRPVRIVVAFSAGGEPDILARAMQPAMQAVLGQPVVIDNRPGATTLIAAEHVAQARPDGYTLLLTSSTTFAVNPHLFSRLPYRLDQFRPITQLMRAQLALYSSPKLPVRTVAELIDYARGRPNGITYATTNRGAVAHLAGERMKQLTGLTMTDVAFRGSAAAAQALIRGDVDIGFDGLATYLGLLRSGEVRALAVTGDKRVDVLPDVPTFAEAGFPDMAQGYWYGLFAPAGVPDAIAARILAATRAGLAGDGLTAQMVAQGATMEGIDPAAFQDLLTSESARWGALIQGIGLKLD
ncbi:Bug family tripartite tricarboxylate transporter substrate binding protein [Humitalea sp. 24SJ18S-53]|uniref:Bug family tripartite tricarboxylate transporter substrate binding protein n=1 Tax=Humitalea sp. 24SJ18S-53 TaxID=3422307 RepID=UPI003D66F7FB